MRAFLLCLALGLLAPALSSQATDLEVVHRDGQSFVTWTETSASGEFYRIYRWDQPIRTADDLDQAQLLEIVDDRSTINNRRTTVEGQTRWWVIEPGGSPLGNGQGLFVHTAERVEDAWYAVTVVVNGNENEALVVGSNTTDASILEIPAPPRPVLQEIRPGGEVWAHWTSGFDTPFQKAMTLEDGQAFNFKINRGEDPGPRGLVLRLHAAGETYGSAFPNRQEVPEDLDVLSTDDFFQGTGWSFWFGAHELFPMNPSARTIVKTFTLERLIWTLAWTQDYLGSDHDPERVSVAGGSMGGIGALLLVQEHPEPFAAAFARNGNYDFGADDINNMMLLENLYGDEQLDLWTDRDLPVYDRTRGEFMAQLDPGRDWPIVRTINGRNDTTSGWSSVPSLIGGMQAARRPAAFYFDQREHVPFGYWTDMESVLLNRTFDQRRDQPILHFGEVGLDDDPGDGDPASGDPIGAVGAYTVFDKNAPIQTATSLEIEVSLRDKNVLDDAPGDSTTARLTPRRLSTFGLHPGQWVRFCLTEGTTLLDEHLLQVDAHGLVQTPPTELAKDKRLARFELLETCHQPPVFAPGQELEKPHEPCPPELFAADAANASGMLQLVFFGPPKSSWVLGRGTIEAQVPTPFGTLRLADPQIHAFGRIGPAGYAWIEIATDAMADETWLYQALVAGQLTNLESVTAR